MRINIDGRIARRRCLVSKTAHYHMSICLAVNLKQSRSHALMQNSFADIIKLSGKLNFVPITDRRN
jgi:hypothetical protein